MMTPFQTEVLARELTDRRLRAAAAHPHHDPAPLPPRRRPLAWAHTAVVAVATRLGVGAAVPRPSARSAA